MTAGFNSRALRRERERQVRKRALAWHHLCNGGATTDHFDNLAYAINVTRVLSEPLGDAAVEVARSGMLALLGVRERYTRLGQFGVDADALRDVPIALDLHDEFLRHCTPLQMTRALEEAINRLPRGEKL